MRLTLSACHRRQRCGLRGPEATTQGRHWIFFIAQNNDNFTPAKPHQIHCQQSGNADGSQHRQRQHEEHAALKASRANMAPVRSTSAIAGGANRTNLQPHEQETWETEED